MKIKKNIKSKQYYETICILLDYGIYIIIQLPGTILMFLINYTWTEHALEIATRFKHEDMCKYVNNKLKLNNKIK